MSEDVAALLALAVGDMGGQERAGQTQMATVVASALESDSHALIQAGTGTGKSLGYLVPAVAYAVRNDARVIVSTATLALQRQIVVKDLPLVGRVLTKPLGQEPRVALLKGRSNYLCKHKLAGGYPEPDDAGVPLVSGPTSELGKQVARLHEWADHTDTGDRDDLAPGVPGRAWAQVSVTGRECLGQKCPLVSECFSEAAKESARRAHVVVTNHAMLGIEATGNEVLGEHHALIIDEAHELVSRITSAATHELTVSRADSAARAARRCGVTTDAMDRAARALDDALAHEAPGRLRQGLPEALATAVALLRDGAREAITAIARVAKEAAATAQVAAGVLTEVFEICEELLGEHGRYVIWLAPPDGEYESAKATRIVAAPLDVAGLIHQRLLADKAAVMTSATLALGGSFDTMSRHLGIEAPVTLDAGSPFDYASHGMLYVAAHLPRPGMGGISEQALDELEALIAAAGGRTLGLFSSHKAARVAAEAMRERLDVPVLYQLDDQVSTLVKQFTDDPRACLFGATTLWQGIDVPGATASLVVIDRIPFPRPDDPVAQARTEAVGQAGGNGFMAISATHAALMLAQGAGRLIRARGDKGVVAVLDPRLATAGYGGFLTRSLPPLWRTTDRDVVLTALARLDAQAQAAKADA